jgi:hypothetical protein
VVQLRLVADAPDASAGAAAEGDAALNGGADEAGQHGRGLAEGIGRRAVIFRLELAAGEQPSHARADGGENLGHVLIAERGCGGKGEPPWPSFAEDAVQHQRMEVDIQLEAAPEALDLRHRADTRVLVTKRVGEMLDILDAAGRVERIPAGRYRAVRPQR